MAADEALLSWVSRGPARLVFRTYAWDRPTLSLGRTERYPEGWDEGALDHASVPLTRRSRSIAEFRTRSFREREALEGHARSVGELLGAHPADLESLGKAIAAALEAEISRRFHALLLPASLADVGILEHPAAAVDAMAVPVAP